MGFVLAIFGCVVLYEFGYVFMACCYGVAICDIILLFIGGVVCLDCLLENLVYEFMVAVAGLMVNVFIGLLFLVQFLLVFEVSWLKFYNFFMSLVYFNFNIFLVGLLFWDYFFFGLIFLNGILVVFNMVFVFFMDGGWVLWVLLFICLGCLKVMWIVIYVGQVLVVGLVVFGVWQFSIIMVVIGIFVFVMVVNEYKMVCFDGIFSKYVVVDIMCL